MLQRYRQIDLNLDNQNKQETVSKTCPNRMKSEQRDASQTSLQIPLPKLKDAILADRKSPLTPIGF